MDFVHYDMQEFILDSLKLLHANVLCCELNHTYPKLLKPSERGQH